MIKMSSNKKKSCYTRFCSHVRTKWPVALLIFSFMLLLLIVFFKWVALDWIIHDKIAEKVRLVPDTDTWKKWTDITVPIFLKFYFFNVTNPLEVMNGAKPRLQEIGPYVYEEKRRKNVMVVDKEKDTIAYKQPITYYFRPGLSSGSERDRIIIINVPFVSVAKLARQMTNISLAYGIADRGLRQRGERLFTFNTVREYLFDGWSVQPYISFLSNPLLALVGGAQIPDSFKGGRFGFYKGKNNSDDGELVVRTGKTNPKEFGRIMSWNGQTQLPHWTGTCNLINGTDGSILPPFISKNEILRFFVPDLCRSLLMIYGSESTYKGLHSYRFILPDPKPVFESPEFCFCPKDRKYHCYKQGVFSLSPCREGAPVAVSAPHFFQAWEPYTKGVSGLNPRKELHDTFIDVEPKTGLLLRATKRLQFNVQVEPNQFMPTFARVPNVLFPFMWVEESAEMTDELLNEIKSQLYDSVETAENLSLGGLLGCSVLIVLGFLGCCLVTCRSSSQLGRLDNESSTGSIESLSRSPSRLSEDTTGSSISRSTMTIDHKATMTDAKGQTKKIGVAGMENPVFVNDGEMQEKITKI